MNSSRLMVKRQSSFIAISRSNNKKGKAEKPLFALFLRSHFCAPNLENIYVFIILNLRISSILRFYKR
jgi:hypothetical protein